MCDYYEDDTHEDDTHEDEDTYTWEQRQTSEAMYTIVHCAGTDNHGYAEIILNKHNTISICTWHGEDGEDDAMYALRDGSDSDRAKATSTDAMLALVETIRAQYEGYAVFWEATDTRRARVYKMIGRRLGLDIKGLGLKQGVQL